MQRHAFISALWISPLLLAAGCSSSSPNNSTTDAASGGPDSGASPDGAGGTDATSGADAASGTDAGMKADASQDSGAPKGAYHPYPSNLLAQVKAAAPAYFGGTSTGKKAKVMQGGHFVPMDEDAGLDLSQFEQTFFGNGPADLYFILPTIDNTINGLSNPSDTTPCINQGPVPYTIDMFNLDAGVQMYAQCYTGGDAGNLVQWGVTDAGTFYLWNQNVAEWTAVIATPVDAGTTPDDAGGDASAPSQAYAVHAWIGVGVNANWASSATLGSYGVIEVQADPANGNFEMSVAGMGLQYCGAQLVSDGVDIFAEGSLDGPSCGATATACISGATGGPVDGGCTLTAANLALTPYGRLQTVGPTVGSTDGGTSIIAASSYPGGAADNIVLDGGPNDSVHFGPSTPTPGVGAHP